MRDGRVIFYGVLSVTTESVVEFFPTRAEAVEMIADVRADEPDTAEGLDVVEVEFAAAVN